MQRVEIEFLEEYKRLDRLCKDMFLTSYGVTEYIKQMELSNIRGNRLVKNWNTDYKKLKHLRWLRNAIAHDSQETDCSLKDVQEVLEFYQKILWKQDPLALLHSATRQNAQYRDPTKCTQNKNFMSSEKVWIGIAVALIVLMLAMMLVNLPK